MALRIEEVHGKLCDMIWSHEATKFLTSSNQKCDESLAYILSFEETEPNSFHAVITGPGIQIALICIEFTPWESQPIPVSIKINSMDSELPFFVKFDCPIFHPLVSEDGVPYLVHSFEFVVCLLILIPHSMLIRF